MPRAIDPDQRARVVIGAEKLLDLDALIVDVETTGLGRNDEIVSIAIVDLSGYVLLSETCKPGVKIQAAAQRIHGISMRSLKGRPTWRNLGPLVNSALQGRPFVAYNAKFDWRLINQTAAAHGQPAPEPRSAHCLMDAWRRYHNLPAGRSGDRKLEVVCQEIGYRSDLPAHDAVADALAAAAVLRFLAGEPVNLPLDAERAA